MKRLAIYFFYDNKGIIREYNLSYIRALKAVSSEVWVVSNGVVTEASLKKLLNITKKIYIRENTGFDVWAYKETLEHIGWKKIVTYDELILCNFTCYAVLPEFHKMFHEMDQRKIDFWGVAKHPEQKNYLLPNKKGWIYEHIMSYFTVIRHRMLCSSAFKLYWESIPKINTKTESTAFHETIFTKHFEELGFKSDSYVPLEQYQGRCNNSSIFYADELLEKNNCPLVKRRAFFFPFYDNILDISDGHHARYLMNYIKNNTSYDENMIWDDILQTQKISTIIQNMHLNYIIPSTPCSLSSATNNKVLLILVLRHEFQASIINKISIYKLDNVDVFVVSYIKKINKLDKQNIKIINADSTSNVFQIIQQENLNLNLYKYFCLIDPTELLSSLQLPYEDYNSYVLSNFLENEYSISNIISKFAENERLGLLISPPAMFSDYAGYPIAKSLWRKKAFEALYKKLDLSVPYDDNLELSIDISCFGRIDILKELLKLSLRKEFNSAKEFLPNLEIFLTQSLGMYTAIISSVRNAEIYFNNSLFVIRSLQKQILAAEQSYPWNSRGILNIVAQMQNRIKQIYNIAIKTNNEIIHFKDVTKFVKDYLSKKIKRIKSKSIKNKRYTTSVILHYIGMQEKKLIFYILSNEKDIYLESGIYRYYPKKDLTRTEIELENFVKSGKIIEVPVDKIKNKAVYVKKSEKEFCNISWTSNISYGALTLKEKGLFTRVYNRKKIYIEDKLHFYLSVLTGKYSFKDKLLWLFLKFNPLHKYIIFSENGGANDNSFELFRYASSLNKNCYFLANKEIIENIKIPQIQKQMVIFNSKDHWKKFLFSKLWIGSFSLRYELFPQSFGLKDIHYYNIPAKWYFIPHGMAVGDKNPIMCHKYSWDEPSKTFCCNKYEQKQFTEKYGFENVTALGFPRMDKWYGAQLDDKNIVLFFTWRFSMRNISQEEFENSFYLKQICQLVQIIRSKFPKKQIYYVFHHEVVKSGCDKIIKQRLGDKNISYIYFNTEDGIQEFNKQFRNAKYLVTDYSSVAYDFAYKEGSIPIYYLDNEFISGHYPLEQRFYDIHLGVIAKTKNELIKALLMPAPTKEMKRRRKEFFKYIDNKNCERVYNAIFSKK